MTAAPLTDLQLSVMRALWKLGGGTLAEVHRAMAEDGKQLATTTVATLLQRLTKQGWVSSKRVGRQFFYKAKVDQRRAARGAVQRLLGSFFGGSLSALTAQLLDADQLTPEELESLRKLLEKKGS